MPILPLALPLGTNKGSEPHAGVATCINCYPVSVGVGQRETMQIWAAPGLANLVTLATTGGVRGILEVDGVALVVAGRSLFQVDSGGSALLIGGIPSDGYVGMARNQRGTGVQTVIVCDGIAWTAVGGSLTRNTSLTFAPIDVCVVNRSAIFATADGRMFRSEIDDGTTVDPLDVAEAESAPDGLSRVIDRGGDLIAIGGRSMEVWSDTGGEAFGFSRAHTVRMGALGPKAVTKGSIVTEQTVSDTVAWCATDQSGAYAGVVMLDGYSPRKISTRYVDETIGAVSDTSTIVATSWVVEGQGFFAFRLTDTTLVYNTSTGAWHERQSRNALGEAVVWRGSVAAVLGGRVLLGDHDNPKLYWLDPDTETEAGGAMVMTCRTPPAHAFPGRLEVDSLYLDVAPGVGLASGPSADTNPMISLRVSRDGETWGSSRQKALGAQAQRATRVSWSRLGTFETAHLEFSCSAAVKRGLMAARWEGTTLPP